MTFIRPARRVLITAASVSALLFAAACGGGSDTPSSGTASGGAADFSQQGDIEYWVGKDTSANQNVSKMITAFNAQHPNGKVTVHELPDDATQQRQQMIQNTQIKNPKMGVLSVDVVWTAEFAAKGYVEALPADQFPTDTFLPATVASATYFNKLYAYPVSSDGGLLYYRKDLLDKYSLKPPTTFDEMKAACDTVKAGEKDDELDCFAGQYQKYEGLTVNFAEAVNGAGGVIVGDDGKPNVATPEAAKGLQTLADWFKDGTIPKAATTWKEEEGRKAFQSGKLIFHRNWGYVYNIAQKTDGSSKVAGKFGVAPLPGIAGPGVSSLGGHNAAIAKNAENKGTAADFLKFLAAEPQQKSSAINAAQTPTIATIYTDADAVKALPYLPIQLKSVEGAKPRPIAVEYGDVSLAITDAAYSALQTGADGQTADAAATLQTLQTKLQSLIK